MKTIIVFDRYHNMLEAFERFLSAENYRVLTVETLDEVAMIMDVMKVDIVIVDVDKSPEFSVLEGLQQMKKKNMNLPIILTATYSDTMTENIAKELDAAALILKPFDPGVMKRTVRELVEKKNMCSSPS